MNRRNFLKASSIVLSGTLAPIGAWGGIADPGTLLFGSKKAGKLNAVRAALGEKPLDDKAVLEGQPMRSIGWYQQILTMRPTEIQGDLAKQARISVRKEGVPGTLAAPELNDGSIYTGWDPASPTGIFHIDINWPEAQRFNTLILHANWLFPFLSAPSYIQIVKGHELLADLRDVTWPLNCRVIRLPQLNTRAITILVADFYRFFDGVNFPALHHPLTNVEVLQLDSNEQDRMGRRLTSASGNMLAGIKAEAAFWCAFAPNQTIAGVNAHLDTEGAKNIPQAFRQQLYAAIQSTDFNRFKKSDNLNSIISRMIVFLRDNKYAVISTESKPRDFNTHRDLPISIFLIRKGLYWGSLKNTIPAINVGGGVTYPMYGNSFSLAALNILRRERELPVLSERLERIHSFLFSGSEPSPRLNEPGDMAGAFWGQEGVLNDKLLFTDQGFRRWIWAHASFIIAYFAAEASLLQPSTGYSYRDSYLRTVAWMLSKQRQDGSWPWFWEYVNDVTYCESSAWCGDAWWAVLALWRGIEAKMFDSSGGSDRWGSEAMARDRAMRAVTFLIEHGCKALEYRGMFEDVGGPCDSFTPSVACLALCKTYDHTQDKAYLEWATRAMELGASMIRHDLSPFVQVESLGVYFHGTSTVFLMLLAAAELNKRAPAYGWNKLSTVGSYLTTTQAKDGNPMYGGLAWNGTLYNPEWQECQMVWVSHRVLAARASAHPKIKIEEDLRGRAFGQKVEFVSLECPGLQCSPEVDYALLRAETDDFLVLLPDPDVSGTATVNLPGRAVHYADSHAPVANGTTLAVASIIVLQIPHAA